MQRFFAPGRTELAGNHTDHQLGRVLAASVDVGITARATRRRDRRVCIHSKGYRPFTVALDDLAVDPRAYGKPWALVRGMAAAILDAGGAVSGLRAEAAHASKPPTAPPASRIGPSTPRSSAHGRPYARGSTAGPSTATDDGRTRLR